MHSKDLNQNRVAEPLVSLAKLPISTDCYRIPLVRAHCLVHAVNRMRLLIRQVPRSTPLTHAGMGVCHAMIHTRPSLHVLLCRICPFSSISIYICVGRVTIFWNAGVQRLPPLCMGSWMTCIQNAPSHVLYCQIWRQIKWYKRIRQKNCIFFWRIRLYTI